MQELEKILEDINRRINEYVDHDYVRGSGDVVKGLSIAKSIVRKHMNDGWIPVEDERLWDILFEEACVEGEQARRIYNRLKKTFDGERSEMNGKL